MSTKFMVLTSAEEPHGPVVVNVDHIVLVEQRYETRGGHIIPDADGGPKKMYSDVGMAGGAIVRVQDTTASIIQLISRGLDEPTLRDMALTLGNES